jgi:hypothetical protein
MIRWSLFLLVACHGGDLGDFYAPCTDAGTCEGVAPDGTDGECLDGTTDGFCTWECTDDAGCAGDQDDVYDFVCSPFESNPGQYCFPSCLEGDTDAPECPEGFSCRSTGGGGDNRKICFPA